MADESWKGKAYAFNQNTACEFFPCHSGVPSEQFNCLFCYCPLYALGENCGGAFVYTENGFKDCSKCTMPHIKDNYGKILSKYPLICELAKKKETENS